MMWIWDEIYQTHPSPPLELSSSWWPPEAAELLGGIRQFGKG